ncbi:hypothetical protein QO005_002933 [Rhizobium paknamense]|uniref:Uncharacterized protein n=1 Tax=Rhizobium paknamense TaxID=1206817 RepID=A0ABU0IH76_9HYPH|nr:hypothetical protein [Rhizobium paknamense]
MNCPSKAARDVLSEKGGMVAKYRSLKESPLFGC